LLKSAGYDFLIIRGKAAEPVYLSIGEDKATIHKADKLWGLSMPEVTDRLLGQHARPASVLGIGPAGENRVRFASLMNDIHRTAGRGGAGAVLGSKNLKAILVRGKKKFPGARNSAYRDSLYQAEKLIRNFPVTSRALSVLGTAGMVRLIDAHDMLPGRNFTTNRHKTSAVMAVSGETLRERMVVRGRGCVRCPVACGRVTRVGNRKGEGPEYETIAILGPNLGIYDLTPITLTNYLCNEQGMDTISFGGSVALAMELFEKGILTSGDTGGRPLVFGSGTLLEDLARETASRQGFGEWLAEGASRLAARCRYPECAMTVKGLELPGYDPRASLHQALGYATSPRGGCHLKGGYLVCLGFFGGAREVDRFLVATAADHCVEAQDSGCVSDMLGICRFLSFSLYDNELARIYAGFTGLDVGPEELKTAARRVQNMERTFNMAAGFTIDDDILPDRMFNEKLLIDGHQRAIDYREQFSVMRERYYQVRGWDKRGVPPTEHREQA
jgi:aldehyde:ferredoxin oxidoreductase